MDYRTEEDTRRCAELCEHPLVKKVNRLIDEQPQHNVRRQLLATSLRLTQAMAPTLQDILQKCVDTLDVKDTMELYVYNSPQLNAACVKPENGRGYLMLSSSLIEALDDEELAFVIGHELGHHQCEHHQIPMGYLVKGPQRVPPDLAMALFAWSRCAEISADRAGALCVSDADATARTLFKLASGVTSSRIQINIDEFAAQVDEMQLEKSGSDKNQNQADWFMTHPFSPLRVKALKLFFSSKLGGGSMPRAELETATNELMGLMSPGYLEEKSAEAETMRRLLLALSVVVIRKDGNISDSEWEHFQKFFGEDLRETDMDLDRIEASLDERISNAKETLTPAKSGQVLRDAAFIARADHPVTDEEKAVLFSAAKKLEVSERIILDALAQTAELD